jgi:hypothetical protein
LQVHCDGSVEVHVAPDPFAPQYPWQQGTSVEHGLARLAQVSTSQKQLAVEFGVPHATFSSVGVRPKQVSPAQHSFPAAVQDWRFSWQVGGAVQTPFVHVSVAVQQVTVPPHDCPVAAHVGPVPPWQVPLVAPGGMSQARPEQQSAVTVQAPLAGWHVARQTPASQFAEQHWAAVVHDVPFGLQSTPHVPETQVPKQHAGFAPPQASPCRAHPPGGSAAAAQAQPISV